jgi:hypothetical protein
MQKPRFKTSEKAAWVFIHTRLRPSATKPTIDRRTAARCGYLLAASRKLNRAEKDLPLPFVGETVSTYVARLSKNA